MSLYSTNLCVEKKHLFSRRSQDRPFFICLFLSYGRRNSLRGASQGCIPIKILSLRLPMKSWQRSSPFIVLKPRIRRSILKLVSSLIAQVYYFHGVNYSIDRVTLNYYHKLFHNSLRDQVITDILQHIIAPINLFTHETQLPQETSGLFNLSVITEREYQWIGVLNMGSSLWQMLPFTC